MNKSEEFARRLVWPALLWLPLAFAHIKNEATQFPDIEFSPARFDIVALVGVGIIPETPVFEPDKPLSMRELASWAALARNVLSGGETPDVAALAAAARQRGLVKSLDGVATLADIDRLFFDGALEPDEPQRQPSKAEAASLIATRLQGDAGKALLERRGLSFGPAGTVTEVAAADGHHGNAYVMTVGGTALPMDAHGRVANGPTDLLQWEGLEVTRSIYRDEGDHAQWIYLEARPRKPEAAAEDSTGETAASPVPDAVTDTGERRLFYWLLAAVAVLGIGLFFRRRR